MIALPFELEWPEGDPPGQRLVVERVVEIVREFVTLHAWSDQVRFAVVIPRPPEPAREWVPHPAEVDVVSWGGGGTAWLTEDIETLDSMIQRGFESRSDELFVVIDDRFGSDPASRIDQAMSAGANPDVRGMLGFDWGRLVSAWPVRSS